MSLRKNYLLSQVQQDDGAACFLQANADGTVPVIYLRRVGGSENEYQKAMDRIMAPHRRAQETKALPPEAFADLLRQVFAEGAIANWKNVKLADVLNDDKADGLAAPTPENKLALLKLLPELHNDLLNFATSRSNYLAANEQAEVKN